AFRHRVFGAGDDQRAELHARSTRLWWTVRPGAARVSNKFEAVMEAFVEPGEPGAAVGVRHGDRPPYVAGFGLADVEWGAAITHDTVFRIGSITKQFTAAAIMLLVEEGRLDLDDAIQSVLPDYPAQGRAITIRRLLNHTAGIKNYTAL